MFVLKQNFAFETKLQNDGNCLKQKTVFLYSSKNGRQICLPKKNVLKKLQGVDVFIL